LCDVEGRELSFVVTVEYLALWHAGILRCFCKSRLDSVGIEIAEVWAKSFIVGLVVDNAAFVGFEFDGMGRDDKILEFVVGVEEPLPELLPSPRIEKIDQRQEPTLDRPRQEHKRRRKRGCKVRIRSVVQD
jgi:hypothetical protein